MKVRTSILILVLVVVVAILRFSIKDFANFAPIAAIGVFCAFYFVQKKWAIVIALVALLLSDLLLQTQTGTALYLERSIDYFGFGLAILFAIIVFKKRKGVLAIAGATIASSFIFFVVSNFGVWATGGLYAKSFLGLLTCFESAIPFYRTTFLGDIFFTTSFFAVFESLKLTVPSLNLIEE